MSRPNRQTAVALGGPRLGERPSEAIRAAWAASIGRGLILGRFRSAAIPVHLRAFAQYSSGQPRGAEVPTPPRSTPAERRSADSPGRPRARSVGLATSAAPTWANPCGGQPLGRGLDRRPDPRRPSVDPLDKRGPGPRPQGRARHHSPHRLVQTVMNAPNDSAIRCARPPALHS